jgi:hypothetical protein
MMASDLRSELQRRESCAAKLETLLKSRPGEWIPMHDLAAVGGIGGWRTRLSELGRRAIDPLTIEHNGCNGAASCHRYLANQPLGRDATVPQWKSWPIEGSPFAEAETWRLT